MINTITEYIKHIPLDAYSMGQKSSHQNSKYWGVQIPDSARKCHIGLLEHFFGTSKEVFKSWTFKTNVTSLEIILEHFHTNSSPALLPLRNSSRLGPKTSNTSTWWVPFGPATLKLSKWPKTWSELGCILDLDALWRYWSSDDDLERNIV